MTRIEEFKMGDLIELNAPRPKRPTKPRPVTESLVSGTVLVRHGRQPTTYTYRDGRSCKHPDGEYHDCQYVDARNRLIPIAEQFAAHTVPPAGDESDMKRARAFCAKMTELARERGLIR